MCPRWAVRGSTETVDPCQDPAMMMAVGRGGTKERELSDENDQVWSKDFTPQLVLRILNEERINWSRNKHDDRPRNLLNP